MNAGEAHEHKATPQVKRVRRQHWGAGRPMFNPSRSTRLGIARKPRLPVSGRDEPRLTKYEQERS